MRRRPPRSARTDTLLSYTTLFRSKAVMQFAKVGCARDAVVADMIGFVAKTVSTAQIGPGGRHDLHQPHRPGMGDGAHVARTFGGSEEHASELQSLMRLSYAVFCLKKQNTHNTKPQARRQSTK